MTTLPVKLPRDHSPGAPGCRECPGRVADVDGGPGVERAGDRTSPAALPRVTTLRRSRVNAGAVVFVTAALVMGAVGAAWELVEAVVR